MGQGYTSALLKTKRLASWKYGRIEARIKLPGTNGFIPAFWLQPEDELYGWFPLSGEIDIMEHPTNEVNKIYGTVHTDAYNLFTGSSPKGSTIKIGDAETTFHLYAIEWSEERIDFYVDDQKYFTFVNDHTGFRTWPFDQPFYLVLNLAVGASWVGNPDASTVFPAIMEIDFVRVYPRLEDIAVNGPDFVSYNDQNAAYSLPFIAAGLYSWFVPGNADIISGQATSQIGVNWKTFGGTVEAMLQTGAAH